ncbi:transposase [Nitrosomonas communis]|uniref:Transposase n=2 Tax=Nitrosomonas communis TaxID=44574 RepID=A0A1H2ZRZ3_9PROT|nr:transposase [Nitrosomonas communis]SDX19439.1 Transposase [Nitrosomonas communis]
MKQKSYSKEFKESVIKKMMPPNAVSVPQLCKETGISDVTLYKWRKVYRNRGIAVPGDNSQAEDKLAVVIETADWNSVQLSEYCRNKGLYPEACTQNRLISGKRQRCQGINAILRSRKKRIATVRKTKSRSSIWNLNSNARKRHRQKQPRY